MISSVSVVGFLLKIKVGELALVLRPLNTNLPPGTHFDILCPEARISQSPTPHRLGHRRGVIKTDVYAENLGDRLARINPLPGRLHPYYPCFNMGRGKISLALSSSHHLISSRWSVVPGVCLGRVLNGAGAVVGEKDAGAWEAGDDPSTSVL